MNLIKPSFSTGYAKNASESANPNLWKGLVGAWMPSFGVTGREVVEVSGRNDNLVSQEPTDHIEWITGKHGKAFSTIDYSYADGGDVSAYIEDGLTVSGYFWMGRNGGTKMIVGQWGAGGVGNASWLVDCVQNKIVARTYNGSAGSAVNSASTMRYQEWQHVACVWNFNTSPFTVTIYFDGRYDAAGSFSSSIFPQVSTNYKVHVGTYPPSISSSTRTNLRWGGHYGDFTIHNRALSPSEIKQLYLNPSAPFQKKTTTVVSVPAAPPTTTAKAVVLKKPKPSYATGYARNASESANPNLWKGLVGAWMPSFGVTGKYLYDLSQRDIEGRYALGDGNVYNFDPAISWVVSNSKQGINLNGANQNIRNIVEMKREAFTIEVEFEWDDFNTNNVAFLTAGTLERLEIHLGGIGTNGVRFIPYRPYGYGMLDVQNAVTSGINHFVFTANHDETSKFYKNGAFNSESSAVGSSNSILGQRFFYIGSRLNGKYHLDGKIFNVKIWNRVLKPSEIKQLYLNPSAPFKRKQQTVGISTAQAFNPYWANQATQLAGTLQ